MLKPSVYTAIGALIRERREQLGITQRDVAKQVGLSRASISNIEAGRQSLYLHHLYDLASVLKLYPWELLPE